MATIQGNLVRLYLYKAVWTLTYSGTGEFKVRVGDTLTAAQDVSSVDATLEAAIEGIIGADNVTVTGGSSPLTIEFAEDYSFSGINLEVEDADATATVAIARTFPASITTATEGNGFYKMGAESSFDKTFGMETQDITNKDSGQYRETASQIRDIALTASNFYLSTENFSALRKQWELGYPVIICDVTPEQYQDYGVYNMTNLSQTSNVNEVVGFSVDFTLTGSVTELTS